ncbi:MAG TPA: lipocalin-like domain-containing protein [Roseiflexaceae bacterium]|nr:lipocalin-like domain-containing protein [Roseiflexaceae bacterium]
MLLSIVDTPLGAAEGLGFARADAPRSFSFPLDHGPHPEYAVEWWYYTGNLAAADGRRYGFQFTIFRVGITPTPQERESTWAARNVYMGHFAFTDVANRQFYADERFSRDGAGLAGATTEPFRVWIDDWSVSGTDGAALPMRLRAATADLALDLIVQQGKPEVLQGDAGLSRKSSAAGNASYYYSLTRMPAEGSVRIGNEQIAVHGLAWMDREWSTSALGNDQVGWDWFALQFDDGRELMFYQLRLRNGGSDPLSSGVLVAADGSVRRLLRDDVRIEVLDTWRSPRSGAGYPARWRISIPDAAITLQVEPLLSDQELPVSVVYWEGAVAVTGNSGNAPLAGSGYIEMTGYIDE